ncbi:MAG: 16S rRNA processing protein RimM [Alteromonadaceae bacterium]|jgi:16S rRNA processing protein RimM
MTQSEKVILGKVGAPYGIKGWLKLTAYTDDPEGIFNYKTLLIQMDGQWKQHTVADWRRHNNGVVFRFANIEDRNGAQGFTNAEVAVLAEDLPDLPDEEFYWRDLIGLNVVNQSGYQMGQVSDILETGANDVLVIKAKPNDAFNQTERLIPFLLEQVVKEVNQQDKVILVDWDPGF